MCLCFSIQNVCVVYHMGVGFTVCDLPMICLELSFYGLVPTDLMPIAILVLYNELTQ